MKKLLLIALLIVSVPTLNAQTITVHNTTSCTLNTGTSGGLRLIADWPGEYSIVGSCCSRSCPGGISNIASFPSITPGTNSYSYSSLTWLYGTPTEVDGLQGPFYGAPSFPMLTWEPNMLCQGAGVSTIIIPPNGSCPSGATITISCGGSPAYNITINAN